MKGFLYGQTEYNILASSARLDLYIKKAKEYNFDFLSITDSTLHGVYKFYKACKQEGIKPIVGLEVRVLDIDNLYSKVLLYAKNNNGYKNLLKINKEICINHLENLDSMIMDDIFYVFVLNDSFLQRVYLSSNEKKLLDEYLNKIKNINAYIGYSMINRPNMMNLNKDILNYVKSFNIPCINIHQMKYLEARDSKIYEALTSIAGKLDKLDEFDDFSFLENPPISKELDYFIDSIDLHLFEEKIFLPKYPNTKGIASSEYLMALCHKGLEKRGIYYKEYLDRLNYELDIIHKMGYDDYF